MNNPSGLGLIQQFAIVPAYQINVQDLTHGLSAYVLDSLNNPRFGLALGYEFFKGAPQVGYTTDGGESADFALSSFGHEASASLSIQAVMGWWWFAVTPKFQYASLRYLDDEGTAVDAQPILKSFGMDVSTTFSLRNWVNIAVIGENLVGNNGPSWTADAPLQIENVADVGDSELDLSRVRRTADYPLTVTHSLTIHPTRSPALSLAFDGLHDFSSFRDQEKVRNVYSGGVEFIAGNMVPIRAGFKYDTRGNGTEDDRMYVGGGLGFIRTPKVGGSGVDVGASFSQQVNQVPGVPRDTVVGLHIGIRIHPDL